VAGAESVEAALMATSVAGEPPRARLRVDRNLPADAGV